MRCSRGFHIPHGSAFRVWLPSWRVVPVVTGPTLFRVGSALGIRPSKHSPPLGWRRVSAPPDPLAVSPVGISRRTRRRAGPTGRGFRAFAPDRSPSRPTGDEAVNRRMLPWALLFQGMPASILAKRPWPPLTRFAADPRPSRLPAPQSSSDPHLAATGRAASAAARSNPHRVFVPVSLRNIRVSAPAGLCVHLRTASHIAVDRPVLFDGLRSLPELSRTA